MGLPEADLHRTTTLQQVELEIRRHADAHPAEEWVRGRGWRADLFPGGLPTRQQLDELIPDRPAHIVAADGRASWVNTRALELAGISRDTPNPRDGVIVREGRTGDPAGVLRESAQELVTRLLPPTPRQARLDAMRLAMSEAHRHGITSVHDLEMQPGDLELYDELRRSGDLKVRVFAGIALPSGASQEDVDALEPLRSRYVNDALLKTGAVTLKVEPPAGRRAPVRRANTRGGVTEESGGEDDLTDLLTLLDARGWQICVQAVSDEAVSATIDALERASARNGLALRDRRHRIEHSGPVEIQDVSRVGSLGLVASVHPARTPAHGGWFDHWVRHLSSPPGEEDDPAVVPGVHRLTQTGGPLVFGSGWPAAPMDPWHGLARATGELPRSRAIPDPAVPPLALAEAIDAYTRGAAYASFDEDRKGTLAPGMLADMVVLSRDIFAPRAAGVREATVDITIFDGQVVYTRTRGTTD